MADKGNAGCCSGFRFFSCPKRMTEKVAFIPPSPPFYDLEEIDPEKYDYAFMISPEVNTTGLRHVKKQRSRYVTTSKGNKIAVLYVNCNERNKFTIIYSHGNAVDLGQIHKLCTEFSVMLECDVVAYDYSGYGRSEGKPSEENLYADVQAVWEYTLTLHEARPENIILFGQSLGTCPSIDLASKEQCAGVILQSPFTSAFDVACPKRRWCKNVDQFRNIEKVPKVTSPVLVIHGTNDEIIDFSHGQAIYERCPRAVEPLWVEGAGHNDIELYGQYVERLRKFINEELSN